MGVFGRHAAAAARAVPFGVAQHVPDSLLAQPIESAPSLNKLQARFVNFIGQYGNSTFQAQQV
jgi:hypothetical protein